MKNIRVLELKIKDSVYKNEIEIRNNLIDYGYAWFMEIECENIRLEIYNNVLVVNAGIIYNGTFLFGVIRDVDFRCGFFESGIIYSGLFKHVVFKNVKIRGGEFIKCKVLSGVIEDGNFIKSELDPKNVQILKSDEKETDIEEVKPQQIKIQENILITDFKTFKMFL